MHTVNSRSGPLVELSREELDCDVLGSRQVTLVGNIVSDDFSEDAVAALFEKFRREAEEVIDIQKSQRFEVKLEILIQLSPEACGLNLEFRIFFNKNPVIVCHRYILFVNFQYFQPRPGLPPRGNVYFTNLSAQSFSNFVNVIGT